MTFWSSSQIPTPPVHTPDSVRCYSNVWLLSLIQLRIRTWGEFGFKLYRWRFTFLNYTKLTKYEALEKNAVSGQQIA
jgi:hypothetical protein